MHFHADGLVVNEDTPVSLRDMVGHYKRSKFLAEREAIGAALMRLQDRGLLAPDADLDALTTTTLAAIQGGLLLAKTSRDSAQLRAALDGAITPLRNS